MLNWRGGKPVIRFGTSGWRAVISDEFTFANVRRVTRAVAGVLRAEGFIAAIEEEEEGPRRYLRLRITYGEDRKAVLGGIRRVSKPGLRVYVNRREVPRVLGGLGIAILSTSQGVMSDREAWRRKIGGEVLCYVW